MKDERPEISQRTNGIGRRSSMIDTSGSTNWTYDARGRMTHESKVISGTGTFLTLWSFNAADQLVEMTYPGDNDENPGEVLSYSYHPQGALKYVYSQTNAYYYLQNASCDEAGRMDLLNLGAADLVSNPVLLRDYQYYDWDTQGGRQQNLQAWKYNTTPYLQELSYSYDPVGNIQAILDARNASQKQCFDYDSMDRLTQATTYNNSSLGCTSQLGQGNYHEEYSYDANTGNLSSKTGPLES